MSQLLAISQFLIPNNFGLLIFYGYRTCPYCIKRKNEIFSSVINNYNEMECHYASCSAMFSPLHRLTGCTKNTTSTTPLATKILMSFIINRTSECVSIQYSQSLNISSD